MAHPVPTKVFPKLSPETAMLFEPFRCTHPPPPVPPFLLIQNLSPKKDLLRQVTSQDERFMLSTDSYIWKSIKLEIRDCKDVELLEVLNF